MKKISLLFALVAFFGFSLLTSCGTDTADETPLLTLSPSSNQSVIAGTTVSIAVTAGENPTSKSALKTLAVDANGVASDTTITFGNGQTTYAGSFNFVAPAAGSSNVVTFTLTDKAGKTTTKSVTITGTSGAGTITTYSSVIMNSATTGANLSGYNSADNLVYTQVQAESNSSKVDLVYFYGGTNQATFAAPNSTLVNGGGTNFSFANNFATKNATTFELTSLTAAEFDAMSDDSDISTLSPTSSSVNMLSIGDVVAFKTAAGKKGLIKITALTATTTGSITFSVKVQN